MTPAKTDRQNNLNLPKRIPDTLEPRHSHFHLTQNAVIPSSFPVPWLPWIPKKNTHNTQGCREHVNMAAEDMGSGNPPLSCFGPPIPDSGKSHLHAPKDSMPKSPQSIYNPKFLSGLADGMQLYTKIRSHPEINPITIDTYKYHYMTFFDSCLMFQCVSDLIRFPCLCRPLMWVSLALISYPNVCTVNLPN